MPVNPCIKIYPGERRIFKKRRKKSTVEWAAKNMRITTGPLKGALWHADLFPYAKSILNLFDRPSLRKLFIVGTSQTGKTTIAYSCLGSAISQRPGPAGICMSNEAAVLRIFAERVIPHFRMSPELSKLLIDDRSAIQNREIRLSDGSSIYGIWSGSEARMSSNSIKYCLIDEEDTYEDKGAVYKIEERTLSYQYTSKIIRFSKVRGLEGESTIWADMQNQSQVIFEWESRCPLCNHYQVMVSAQIKYPPDKGPKEIKSEKLSRYVCEKCGAKWDDLTKNRAVGLGRISAQNSAPPDFSVAGVYLPAWISPFMSLSTVSAEFLAAKNNGPVAKKHYTNSFESRPYKVVSAQNTIESLKNMIRADIPPQVAPQDTIALVAGFDMQASEFYFSVRAIGKSASYLIDYGKLKTFADIETLIFDSKYRVQNTNQYVTIWRAGLDTGGTRSDGAELSRTVEAYNWLKTVEAYRVIYGTKGSVRAMPANVRLSRIGLSPELKNRQETIPLVHLDTEALKDILHDQLHSKSRYPAWLHAKTGEDYLRHLTSEVKRLEANQRYRWHAGRRVNHWLDCEVIALACADPMWSPAIQLLDRPTWSTEGFEHKKRDNQIGQLSMRDRLDRLGNLRDRARSFLDRRR